MKCKMAAIEKLRIFQNIQCFIYFKDQNDVIDQFRHGEFISDVIFIITVACYLKDAQNCGTE